MANKGKGAAKTGAKKSSGALKIILIALACIAVVVVGIVLLFNVIMSAGGKEPKEFVNAISRGELSKAYDFFTEDLKEVQSFEEFSDQIEGLNLDKSCEFRTESTEISGDTKDTKGKIECDSQTLKAEFGFIKVDSDFKLISYSIKAKK